jgi:tetratricopeptide (TPR) repeat protein
MCSSKELYMKAKNMNFFFLRATPCMTPCPPWLLFLLFVFLFFGCSSAPKPTGEIYADRNNAFSQIELANKAASRGRYEDALKLMDEAQRLARSTDDPELRIRTAIGRGDILFSIGDHDNALIEWENAIKEGESSGQSALVSLARIYTIRAKLLLLANGTGTDATAEELRAQVNSEMTAFRDDEISGAVVYITLGLAEKALGRWNEAENAVRRALAIHEENHRLEDAAYDWFLIASIHSVSGNYDKALEALRSAISFDRRSENGFGLASSWEAMGDVNYKAGKTEDAQAAWRRAAEIYEAIGLPAYAERIKSQS